MLRDVSLTFWTTTLWESERAMRAFMLAGAHRKAMHSLLEWCDEAALAHWSQDDATLPELRDGPMLLKERGRTSKVLHPSDDHQAFSIPPPRVETTRILHFR